MDNHKAIEDRAAEFLARRDSGEWTAADDVRLNEWLVAATANRVAFLRLEAVWGEARRLKALGAGLSCGTAPPPGAWGRTPFFAGRESETDVTSVSGTPELRRNVGSGRTWLRWGAAAAILLAVLVSAYIYLVPRGDRYSTPVGEVASVPLRDGSRITLNTASMIRVDLTPKERRVDLERGEAFFVVAKDPSRPFLVEAGSKRVIAVGTQFSVRRDGNDVRVVVTEGAVRLESIGEEVHVSRLVGDATPQGSSGSAVSELARLTAGTIARTTDGDVLVQERSIPEAEEALSWRAGYLTFQETTLAEAVEEFNRYNTHRITIEDPKVAAIQISGTFRPTNYAAFLRLLESGYSIHSSSTEEETRLSMN